MLYAEFRVRIPIKTSSPASIHRAYGALLERIKLKRSWVTPLTPYEIVEEGENEQPK